MRISRSPAVNQLPNVHATGLLLSDRGVLLAGASGSGKTTLAHMLLQMGSAEGRFARLVGDDRMILKTVSGRLLALVPGSIGGVAEVYGSAVHAMAHEPRMVVHLLIRLCDPADAPRFQPDAVERLEGVDIPVLHLEHRNTVAAALAVRAKLSLAPFTPHQ